MSRKKISVDGNAILLHDAFNTIKNPLIDLVAQSSIWVSPERVSTTAIYPNVKRGAPKDRGRIIDGIRIDDNTYANRALKEAISKSVKFENYEVCHIWPYTTYDERYHTLLQNLVMIPRVLARLSDYYPEVINVLKYRAWELYKWCPEGSEIPAKPDYYPLNWGTAVPDLSNLSDNENITSIKDYHQELDYEEDRDAIEIDKVKNRVPKWIRNSTQINSRILNLYMKLSNNGCDRVTRNQFKEQFDILYQDSFESNYNQMKNFGLKNHGKVFNEYIDGSIRLWEPVADFIKSLYHS